MGELQAQARDESVGKAECPALAIAVAGALRGPRRAVAIAIERPKMHAVNAILLDESRDGGGIGDRKRFVLRIVPADHRRDFDVCVWDAELSVEIQRGSNGRFTHLALAFYDD